MIVKQARLWPRNGYNYIVWYDKNGKEKRRSCGKDKRSAIKMLAQFNDWLLQGLDPLEELLKNEQKRAVADITIGEFYEIFKRDHAKQNVSPGVIDYWDDRMETIRKHGLASMKLAAVTKNDILQHRIARGDDEKTSNATINREVSLLKNMYNRAIDWEKYGITINPTNGVKPLKEPPPRDVVFSDADAERLMASLPPVVKKIVEFAIYTGFRKQNILDLTIKQVNFDERTVKLKVKGGKFHTYPVSYAALEVVKESMGERAEGYVFINQKTRTRYKCIENSFNRQVRKLNLTVNETKFRFHDLRHVFGTWLAANGIQVDSIQKLMGHKDKRTTIRYVNERVRDERDTPDIIKRIGKNKKEKPTDEAGENAST
ncbi:MAG: tyrosine-type recombinase/integrase [Candidatus Latescibacterota bacterium]